MTLDAARAIADTILYEGYILYPYRASHGKNQAKVRWQFGVLVPQGHAAANPLPPGAESLKGTVSGAAETWYSRTECIAEPRSDGATLDVRLRFLQVQFRVVEERNADDTHTPVEQIKVDDQLYVTWEEGLTNEIDFPFKLSELSSGEVVRPVELPASEHVELLGPGGAAGRVRRVRQAMSLRLRVEAEPLPGPYGIYRVGAVVENVTAWAEAGAGREDTLRHSPVATNLILLLSGGSFISMLDPPEWAKPAVASCTNEHVWPVLVGGSGDQTVLSSPMVLPDHPEIAPESPMDLFDGLENDELLSLRIMTLTDEEKAQARATDPRAAAIVDSVDNLPPEIYERLHGAIRSFRQTTGAGRAIPESSAIPEIWMNEEGQIKQPPIQAGADDPAAWFTPEADGAFHPETDVIVVKGTEVARGSRVRLHPAPGVSDAQDMFLEGREASVQAILFDLEQEPYMAVTLDDDPLATEIMISHGRYLYFKPHEVEPIS